jgi:hypothetical protein
MTSPLVCTEAMVTTTKLNLETLQVFGFSSPKTKSDKNDQPLEVEVAM